MATIGVGAEVGDAKVWLCGIVLVEETERGTAGDGGREVAERVEASAGVELREASPVLEVGPRTDAFDVTRLVLRLCDAALPFPLS